MKLTTTSGRYVIRIQHAFIRLANAPGKERRITIATVVDTKREYGLLRTSAVHNPRDTYVKKIGYRLAAIRAMDAFNAVYPAATGECFDHSEICRLEHDLHKLQDRYGV